MFPMYEKEALALDQKFFPCIVIVLCFSLQIATLTCRKINFQKQNNVGFKNNKLKEIINTR